MSRECRRRRFNRRNPLSVQRAEPAVLTPDHFLNRGFAAERAATTVAQGPATQVDHVGLSVLGFDEVRMAGPLQFRIRALAGAENVRVRMQFVGAG